MAKAKGQLINIRRLAPICECAQHHKSLAFSLVEMLMALLVASLLMAALAPVMTKRMNADFVNIGGMAKSNLIPACAYVNNTTVDMVFDNNNGCKVPEGKYSMSAIIVSGGGGGGGAAGWQKVTERKIEINGVRTEVFGTTGAARNQHGYNSKTFNIDSTMSDIEVEIVGGGNGGADGAAAGGHPASQADCGSWGYYFDPAAQMHSKEGDPYGFCIALRNPGDGGTDTPSRNVTGVTSVPAGSTCSALESGNCCWYGNTANSNVCNSVGGGYSGCNRTVCQWNASRTICANWRPSSVAAKNGDWGKLPDVYQLDALAVHAQVNGRFASYGGQKALQICSINVPAAYKSSLTRCDAIKDGCIGTNNNNYCIAYDYWGDDGEGPENTHSAIFVSDNVNYTYVSNKLDVNAVKPNLMRYYSTGIGGILANSPRCVINNVERYHAYHGGGGSGGMYARQKIPNDVLKKAFTNVDGTQYKGTLQLTLYAGHGGDWHSDEVKNNTRSSGSWAELKKDGVTIWRISVPNGFPGAQPNPALAGTSGWNTARPGDNAGTSFSVTDTVNNYCSHYNVYSLDGRHKNRNVPCGLARFDLIMQGGYGVGSSTVYPSNIENAGYGGRAYWRTAVQALNEADGQYGEYTPLDGIEGKDGAAPGAGGSGSFCTQGSTRLKNKCGKSGSGAGGGARFTYKKTYPGAGGGGGGAGTLLHIRNIQVTPGEVIQVQAGAQGSGGQAGGNGTKGGDSFIKLGDGTKYTVTGGNFGQTATPAIITSTAQSQAKGGKGGSRGTVTQDTLDKLNLKNGKDVYYPSVAADTDIANGNDAPNVSSDTPYQSSGGNGGVNSKISALAGLHGIPCGAYSTSVIKLNNKNYTCGSIDIPANTFDPVPLTRMLVADDIKLNIGSYINTYAPGATGGGGGGWSVNSYNATESVGKGANGLGGYVIIYFN